MQEITINGQPLTESGSAAVEMLELQEWATVQIAATPIPGAVDARLQLGQDDLGQPATTPFDPTWRWSWQPGGIAGVVPAELQATLSGGRRLLRRFALQLKPRAIDRRTFQELLSAIVAAERSLALRLGGQALAGALLAPLDDRECSALEEAQALLQRHGHMLTSCLAVIAGRPAERLRPLRKRRRLGEVQSVATINPRDLTHGPLEPPADTEQEGQVLAALRAATGGPLPPDVVTAHTTRSYDTPEHRFAVWLAGELARRARAIHSLAQTGTRHHSESRALDRLAQLAGQSQRLARDIGALRSQPPLAGLPRRPQPPHSRLLRRDRRYRPLLQIWRELREAPLLLLDTPQLLLPIADLPALYETWAALSLCAALSELGEVQAQRLFEPQQDGWTLRLQRRHPLLELHSAGRRLAVHYQPRYEPYAGLTAAFGSLDRYLRIPDLSIEVEDGAERWLAIFDAKYRLAADGHAPQDALDDIYAYKGSLGCAGRPQVRYAGLLYPGQGSPESSCGVAMLPHLPQQTSALREALAQLLSTHGAP